MSYSFAGLKTGDIIGKAKVIIDIVPKSNVEIRPAIKMIPKYVTIHNTGNIGEGADAEAHNKLMHNMAKKHPRDTSHISWHVAIDEDFIYVHIPFDETAWHCGDGKGIGNMTSIGLEICMHSDQKNYLQAEQNAALLSKHLIDYYKLPYSSIKPHQHWSGKFCPQIILRRDGSLDKFISKVKVGALNTTTSKEGSLDSMLTHKVLRGETLGGIAKKYNVAVEALVKLNNLKNANMIYVDQVLVIKEAPKFSVTSEVRNACLVLIDAGVKEGLFYSKHEDRNKYEADKLVEYAKAYVDRKLETKKK